MFYNINPATSPYTVERTTLAVERAERRYASAKPRGYLVEARDEAEATLAVWARFAFPERTVIVQRGRLPVLRLNPTDPA